jgi:hypothetical protein
LALQKFKLVDMANRGAPCPSAWLLTQSASGALSAGEPGGERDVLKLWKPGALTFQEAFQVLAQVLHQMVAVGDLGGIWNVLHDAPSAHRFLYELDDPYLFSGSQLLQREGNRPQGAFVEVRAVVEAEGRVPRLELVRGLEEANDLAVPGIRRHPVPELRREGWRAGFDDCMEPLREGAIRWLHLADLCEHGAFPVRLVRFQFFDALPHRASFLVRKSLDRLRGLLRRLLVDVVFGGHAMISFLLYRPGKRVCPPVKQTVKRLSGISISCFEKTVGESSGIRFTSHFERTPGGMV